MMSGLLKSDFGDYVSTSAYKIHLKDLTIYA